MKPSIHGATLRLPALTPTFAPTTARLPLPKRVDSGSLMAGHRELIIEHAGCEYRLRRTQNDKLILTK